MLVADSFDESPSLPDGGFGAIFILFLIVFVGVAVFIVTSIIRNARRARAAGFSPVTMQTDLTVRALNSDLLAPARSTGERLAEIDALAAAGTITPEERSAARAKLLGG